MAFDLTCLATRKANKRSASSCSLGRRRDGDAAGIGMLDDRDRRPVELGDQLVGGVGVVEIVVAERLALQLAGGGDAGPRRRAGRPADIEGGLLVRVLAIAQRLGPPRR